MCSVLNKLLEFIYFYISKDITSYIFLLFFKIAEILQCILNDRNILRKAKIFLLVKVWRELILYCCKYAVSIILGSAIPLIILYIAGVSGRRPRHCFDNGVSNS